MAFRKCNLTSVVLLVFIVFMIGYGYIILQDDQLSIESRDHEIVKRREHENVLQEQLKVVYHHAQRVEAELKKERERHKNTRSGLLQNKKEFYSNITKTKHEAWTRFNALDSDHKMLKAEHEETKISLSSLQSQYKRLSSDHQRIIKQSKEDFDMMKDSKDRESLGLQDRIQELYKKNIYYRQLADKNEEYYLKLKEHLNNCTKISIQYKDLLQKHIDEKAKLKHNNNEPTQHIVELHSELNDLQAENSKLYIAQQEDKNRLKQETGNVTQQSQATVVRVETTKPTTEKNRAVEDRPDNFIRQQKDRFMRRIKTDNEKNAELPPNNRYEGKRHNNDHLRPIERKTTENANDRNDLMTFSHQSEERPPQQSRERVPRDSKGNKRPLQPVKIHNNVMKMDKRNQLKAPVMIDTTQTPAIELEEGVETSPPGVDIVKDEKKNSPILKGPPDHYAQDEKAKEERLDVKKVTLEDDENGDQNLDKHIVVEPGNEIDHEGEENGKEEDEQMEEKLPNILENNEK